MCNVTNMGGWTAKVGTWASYFLFVDFVYIKQVRFSSSNTGYDFKECLS